jgi:hypothetical protein
VTLNQINPGVTGVPATAAMFETHFGLRRVAGFPDNPKKARFKSRRFLVR